MKDTVIKVFLGVCILALIGGVIYGSYRVAKTVSYSIFYEDMVRETVTEMVKREALR